MNKTGNDELTELGYTSSAPDLVQRDEPRPVDEAQVSTLDEVLELLRQREQSYKTVDALSLEPDVIKVLSVEQQLAVNKKVVFHIQEMKTMLETAIRKVRDKQNGVR